MSVYVSTDSDDFFWCCGQDLNLWVSKFILFNCSASGLRCININEVHGFFQDSNSYMYASDSIRLFPHIQHFKFEFLLQLCFFHHFEQFISIILNPIAELSTLDFLDKAIFIFVFMIISTISLSFPVVKPTISMAIFW